MTVHRIKVLLLSFDVLIILGIVYMFLRNPCPGFLCRKKLFMWKYRSDNSVRHVHISRNISVYWNVPSDICRKHDVDFRELSEKFGIIQNNNDKFIGDKVVLIQSPGHFPDFTKIDKETWLRRNNGIPQNGDLISHLDDFQRDVLQAIPNKNFSGLAVIDFDKWPPVFDQLQDDFQIYKDHSLDIEREKHPEWDELLVSTTAQNRYEMAAKKFMMYTLEIGKTLRSKANWGYRGYPYCHFWSPNQIKNKCSDYDREINNNLSWLYENGTLFLPSIYLTKNLNNSKNVDLVGNRVQEAVRVAKNTGNREKVKVLPYYWLKYEDQPDVFVQKGDLTDTFKEIMRSGADGVIIWGQNRDVDDKTKCKSLLAYVEQVLGPAVLEL